MDQGEGFELVDHRGTLLDGSPVAEDLICHLAQGEVASGLGW